MDQWLVIAIVIAIGMLLVLHIVASALKYETDLAKLRHETHRLREEFLRRKREREVVAIVDPVDDLLPNPDPGLLLSQPPARKAA